MPMRQLTYSGEFEPMHVLAAVLQQRSALVPDPPRPCPCGAVTCETVLLTVWGWVPDGLAAFPHARACFQLDAVANRVATAVGVRFLGSAEFVGTLADVCGASEPDEA